MADSTLSGPRRSLTEDEMAEVKKEILWLASSEGKELRSLPFEDASHRIWQNIRKKNFESMAKQPEKLTTTKKVLERMRRYLCDKIIAERHFDYLRSKKILSREDTEEIACRTSSRKKAGKLLDYLAEHPKGLDALVESIRCERTQNFLLEKITDAVLKVKNEKLESLKGLSCSNCTASVCEQTNSFSRSQLKESSISESRKDRGASFLQPEEYMTTAFVSATSLCSMNLPITEVGNVENSIFSATLPGPGDSGAPELPPQLQNEQEETCSSSSDSPFQPLRSRSLVPQ